MPVRITQPIREIPDEDELVRLFETRRAMAKIDYEELATTEKQKAFTVAKAASLRMIQRVQLLLAASIAEGSTLATFRERLARMAEVFSKPYSELVLRMATVHGYNNARRAAIEDPDIADEFPWIMYDAILDTRVRDNHAAMDGKAWRREEFPAGWWPPNGYNCRCTTRALNEALARRIRAEIVTGPPPALPDDGFFDPEDGDVRAAEAAISGLPDPANNG